MPEKRIGDMEEVEARLSILRAAHSTLGIVPSEAVRQRDGSCPQCGYAVGAEGRWISTEGEPIERRYRDVVLEATG